jgi:hypothetical protein
LIVVEEQIQNNIKQIEIEKELWKERRDWRYFVYQPIEWK